MTAPEACTLLVDTVQALSAMRAERDSWRLLALAQIRHLADLTRDLEMVDERRYIHRTRVQDDRDLFLDHRDIRREAA